MEGLVHPPKNKTAMANLAKAKVTPVELKNQYQTLCGETPQAGLRKEPTPAPIPTVWKMPTIMAKVRNMNTTFVNAVKVQTSGLVTFEST